MKVSFGAICLGVFMLIVIFMCFNLLIIGTVSFKGQECTLIGANSLSLCQFGEEYCNTTKLDTCVSKLENSWSYKYNNKLNYIQEYIMGYA